ncbi:glutamyl-tRNA synthetase [Phanerochaete sordida]|uniref:Glutamate--tRNA ligase, mitochondrial n=1 Tax=Phanerochaete sordida TaxID=48140 RepID=A0A9P3LK62_9APHY|nr:glutamyl-tRNA synthetase [Phanerochaete sordida]
MVRLRFAPSPTGSLHLGGLRTALYNYLFARKNGGEWILRIEDTDSARAVPGAVDNIRSALAWAGLEYDFGPGKHGPHGPYFQSERLDLYHMYSDKLLESGRAYRCFCSADKLQETRERLARLGSNATYDKTCLNLTEEEVARRVRAGEKSVVRLNDSNLPRRTTPPDLVFGSLKDAHASLPTDPVLLKSDMFPTYHLASVVDDHEMGITHVCRGEEWLLSLPLHLDLYASLGLQPPQFAHLPLLLNPDGTKMSKRKGDVQVFDYKRRGWDPQAVLNWLALAGWGHTHAESGDVVAKQAPDSTAVMTLAELVREFDLEALTHRRTVLDPMKLEYLNKHHLMRTMSSDDGLTELAERVHDIVKAAFPLSPHTTVPEIKRVIQALQGRMTNLQDIPTLAPYFFVDPDLTSPEAQSMSKLFTAKDYAKIVPAIIARLEAPGLQWELASLTAILHDQVKKLGVKQKALMNVVRRQLTGMKTGPGIAEIMLLLGKDRTLERMRVQSS